MKKSITFFLVFCVLCCCAMSTSAYDFSGFRSTEETCFNPGPNFETDQKMSETAENTLLWGLEKNSLIFNYIDKASFRQQEHIARIESLEDLNTYVFLNRDGTNSMYLLSQDVKFVDDDGLVKEKDIRLVSADDKYMTKKNNIGLSLPKKIQSGIEISLGDNTITFAPDADSDSDARLNSDNTITYKNIYEHGIDINYTPTLTGVKEDIVLHNPTSINEYTFAVKTDLSLYNENGICFFAKSENAEVRMEVGEIFVYDSNGNSTLGDIVFSEREDGYLLKITVQKEFLESEDIVYPVTVDPSINIISDGIPGSNVSIQDSTIYELNPNNNYDNSSYCFLGDWNMGGGVAKTAIRLKGLETNSIFSGLDWSDIKTAAIYVKSTGSGNTKRMYIRKMLGEQTWTGNTVTWNNVGTIDGSSTCSGYIAESFGTKVDIKAIAQMWKVYNYSSYCMVCSIENEDTNQAVYCSANYGTDSYQPYVIINYNDVVVDRTASTYGETNLYKNALVNYQNCYGYALQVYSDDISPEYRIYTQRNCYLQQPGEFSLSAEYEFDNLLCDLFCYATGGSLSQYINFIDAKLKSDFARLYQTEGEEWQILDSTANATVPDGYRKICLVVGNSDEVGFHFYMRHSDGSWSHKPGSTTISNRSIGTEVLITDVNIASVANEGTYTGGLQRYYLIKKSAVNEYYHCNPLNGCSTFYYYAPGGNTIEKSLEINAGTTQLKLDYARDVDYFAFTPQISGYYGINTYSTLDINGLSNSDLNVNLGVYDEAGILIATGSYAFGEASVGCNMIGNKTYYIRFWSQANETCTSNMQLRMIY